MPIREESYDLFGAASGSPAVYSYEKAVSTSASGNITGNALDLRALSPANVPEYRVLIKVTTAITGLSGSDTVTAEIQHSDDNGSSDAYATILTSGAVKKFAKGDVLLEARLPLNCKRWIKAKVTNAGTATAGKVGGHVEAILK